MNLKKKEHLLIRMNMHEVSSIVEPHASGMSATVSMRRLRVKYSIVNVLHKLEFHISKPTFPSYSINLFVLLLTQ